MSSSEMSEEPAIPVTTSQVTTSQMNFSIPVTASQMNLSIQGNQIIHTAEGERLNQNVCIGGTQINKTKRRNKRSPQERWEEDVLLNIQGKSWTSVCARIKLHLQDNAVAIIIGSPGEGKTTLAHLLLNDFKNQNWNIAIPQNPKEYFDLKQRGKTIFLFNDILGIFEVDDSSMKAWIKVFDDLRNRLDKQTSESMDNDCSSLKVIFVQRDYIWKEVKSKIGKYVNNLFKEGNVCNLTVSLTLGENDKLELLNIFEKKYKLVLSRDQKQQIVSANIPHGFPHCCELMFILAGAFEKSLDVLHNPISFLNETMMQFCHDDVKRIVLSVMLRNGGTVDLKVINTRKMMENELRDIGLLSSTPLTREKFFHIKSVFKCLDGSYLRHDEKCLHFSHASILQSAAVSIGKVDPELLIRFCSIEILQDLLKPKPKSTPSVILQNRYFFIHESEMHLTVERFISEMSKGHLSGVISSTLFEDDTFVRCFFAQMPDSIKLFQFNDIKTKQSCFYHASQSGKNMFLKELIDRYKLNRKYIEEALFGVCEYGNIGGLRILLHRKDIISALAKRNEERDTPLLSAARNSQTAICRILLFHEANVNSQDKAGNTALHLAAERGNTEMVELLIQKTCKLDLRNGKMQTALHIALLSGHPEASKLLIKHGADFTLMEKMGLTALHCASSTGLTDIVQYLIQRGCDVHALNKRGSSAMIKAAEGGHVDTVRLLHKKGSDVNQANKRGFTALHMACKNGHVKVVQLLIRIGCEIDKQSKYGLTGLIMASVFGRKDVVKVLIRSKCNLELKDIVGRTALCHATMALHDDIALLLMDNGCNVNVLIHFSVSNLMKMACDAMEGKSLKRFLLELITPLYWLIDSLFQEGILAIPYYAILTCQRSLIASYLHKCPAYILTQRVSPVFMFSEMMTFSANAQYYARLTGDRSYQSRLNPLKFAPIAAEFLHRGADVDEQDDNGATILHHAAGAGHLELMDILHHAGCTLDKKDKRGQTPLHYASWYGQMEAVQWLLERNADPFIADTRHHTALHFAILGRHHAVADVLEFEGCRVSMPVQLLYSVPYLRQIWYLCCGPVLAMAMLYILWLVVVFVMKWLWLIFQ